MPWWQLKNVADANRVEQAAYNALPPDACPYDGTPLEVGQQSQAGGKQIVRHCPMGDFQWNGGQRLT